MMITMHALVFVLIGLICAVAWLAFLVATGFSSPIVGLGLLGLLALPTGDR
ncbi:MAG: hypothetical protein JOZ41_21090 [Chloroflexi bacterium]|nr:hypothetical protein [Chloroflexota bacterium]